MSAIDRIRRPEHTGPNRCWPCTVVNAVLLAVGALAVGALFPPAGAAVAVLGAAAIWLRGYLVPGTPRFAPRLVAALPFEFPGKAGDRPADAGGSVGGEAEVDGDELIERLAAAGVLGADAERVTLDPAFEETWAEEQASLREASPADLAAALTAVAPGDAEATAVGSDSEWYDLGGGTWLSRPVAVAEVAAVRALEAHSSLDPATRRAAAAPLRSFLERCPACGTDLVETDPRDCCGGGDPRDEPEAVLACPDCNRQLFAFEP